MPARVCPGRDSGKGARGGREEAPEVAGPSREEDAGQAEAIEEDVARQVVGLSAGSLAVPEFGEGDERSPC